MVDVYDLQKKLVDGQIRLEQKVDSHIIKDESNDKWIKRWIGGLTGCSHCPVAWKSCLEQTEDYEYRMTWFAHSIYWWIKDRGVNFISKEDYYSFVDLKYEGYWIELKTII